MATANFHTMQDFDLYAIDLEMPAQYWDFLDIVDTLDLDAKNDSLEFHRIHILPGYYSGDQIFIETIDNFRDFDDDDAEWFLGISRNDLLMKYENEIREIRRWMRETLPPLGFQKIEVVARLGNGETWYAAA